MPRASATTSLQKLSEVQLINRGDSYMLSAYQGKFSEKGWKACASMIRAAFPKLDKEFYIILKNRIADLKFNDQRLVDSVKSVIDNCEYPEPTIANFIKFDKSIELLDHQQFLRRNDEMNGKASDYYKAVSIENVDFPLWAHVRDILLYNLKQLNPKKVGD